MSHKTAWIIAAALVLVFGAILTKVIFFPSHSGATSATLRAGALDQVEVEGSPAEVFGRPRTGSGNAGDDYARAIALVREPGAAETIAEALQRVFHDPPRTPTPEQRQLLERVAADVRAGAEKPQMRFVFEHTPREVVVGSPMSDLAQALGQVLAALVAHGQALENEGQYAQAERVYQDAMAMGYDLVRERARVWTVQAGLGMQAGGGSAGQALLALYAEHLPDRQDQARRLRAYLASVEAVSRAYQQKMQIVKRYNAIVQNPGDIYNVALHDGDRAWRVEAIATLGLLRYTTSRRGDRRYVDQLLARFRAGGDPLEAAAAEAAANLTREQFRALGSVE